MGLIDALARRVELWRGPGKVYDAGSVVEDHKRLPARQGPTGAPTLQNIITPQTLYHQYQRVGGQITPLQVSSILQETDVGYMYRFVDMANEFRQKDSHLQALLGTREIALSGLEWRIKAATKPGQEHPTARAKSIAEFVDNVLRNAEGRGQEVRGFHDAVMHLAGAVYFGYAVTEVDWIEDGGQLVARGFRPIPPRRFRYRLEDGRLEWWDSQGMVEGVDIQARFPDKFLVHQPRVNGDSAPREGLARVLIWPVMFRNWGMADWLRLAELAWKPWRRGIYKNTASKEDIDDLIAALDRLATQGYAVHSDRVDVDVSWPKGGRGARSAHGEICEFLADEMSKAVLGQTLTTQQGERGARSLGEVHDRVRRDIAEADAVAMASTIRREFVAPLVRLNFGPDELVPVFEFITEDTPDIGTFSRGIQALQQAGLRMDQAWVRDKIGAPEPAKDADLLLGTQALVFDERPELTKLEHASAAKPDGKKPDDKKDDEGDGGKPGSGSAE